MSAAEASTRTGYDGTGWAARWSKRRMFCKCGSMASMPANIEPAAVRHERQRDTVTGMMPRHMPTFWNAWKPNQHAIPAAATRPNTSSVCRAIERARQMTTASRAIRMPAPTRPASLPRHREDEVGALLGHEARSGLGAVEQSLAEQPAVADGDPGLLNVVAGPARVEVGIAKANRSTWYCLSRPGGHCRRREGHTGAGEQQQPAARRPGRREHAEDRRRQHQHRAEVGWPMISTAGTPAIASMPITSALRIWISHLALGGARRPAGPCR